MCDAYQVPSGSEERFYMHGDRAYTLRSQKPGDLDYQSQLTRDLLGCKPILRSVPNDVASYVKEIEAQLNLPVVVESTGPRSSDKRWA
jgi:hypothetical protein